MPRELFRARGGTWDSVLTGQSPQNPNFTYTPDPDNGLIVTFAGTATGGTTPYTWTWEFGDAATGTGQTPTHTYTAAGDYAVAMTVRGADGKTNRRTKTITVQASGGGGTAGSTIFGSSMKIPDAAAPAELNEYKAFSDRVALLKYFDNEMRGLS